jgi:nucleotide-binding universal stress UspA family protein
MWRLEGLGRVVVVPIINPASALPLVNLAARLTDPGGTMVPITVIPPDAPPAAADAAEELVIRTEEHAMAAGVTARGVIARGKEVADEVLATAGERNATLVVMGWQGRSTQRNVFGEIIDSIVGRSATPLAVARLQDHPYRRILLAVGPDHLTPSGSGGVALAADYVRRLASHGDLAVRVVRSGPDHHPLPESLTSLADRVHHDPRRHDLAVRAAAERDDLIVVPVAPTTYGLREATTHIAWAAPEAALLIAIDVGPSPTTGLADAVSDAGRPPAVAEEAEPAPAEHHVVVTVRAIQEPAENALADALADVGPVAQVQRWHEQDLWCLQAEVTVTAPTSNQALATVMTALHEAAGFHGAEIRYDLADDVGPG